MDKNALISYVQTAQNGRFEDRKTGKRNFVENKCERELTQTPRFRVKTVIQVFNKSAAKIYKWKRFQAHKFE